VLSFVDGGELALSGTYEEKIMVTQVYGMIFLKEK